MPIVTQELTGRAGLWPPRLRHKVSHRVGYCRHGEDESGLPRLLVGLALPQPPRTTGGTGQSTHSPSLTLTPGDLGKPCPLPPLSILLHKKPGWKAPLPQNMLLCSWLFFSVAEPLEGQVPWASRSGAQVSPCPGGDWSLRRSGLRSPARLQVQWQDLG